MRAAYLQIYNEGISDLLKPERTGLTIRETKRRGLYVENLSEWVVRSPAEVDGLLERGAAARTTAATKANELSSRSHAVFILIVEQSCRAAELRSERRFCVAKLNLVDLAGTPVTYRYLAVTYPLLSRYSTSSISQGPNALVTRARRACGCRSASRSTRRSLRSGTSSARSPTARGGPTCPTAIRSSRACCRTRSAGTRARS